MIDVLVIGGGPAGTTAATLLAREGMRVLLLERERFPRFQIGESLLPYNNDVFRRLGILGELEQGSWVPKYGGAFLTADGLHATTFRFDRTLQEPYRQAFQVKRADFDLMLMEKARAAGVDVREGTAVVGVDLSDPRRAVVEVAGGERLEARFVIDASGHGSVIGQRQSKRLPVDELRKVAFFAHFRGVARDEGRDAGNTVIVILKNAWFWLIPISPEVTSVGLVVDSDFVKGCGLEPEELLVQTIAASPVLAERMAGAERVTKIYARKDFSYRIGKLVGPNFALAGDAAGFLDPIFSTGVLLAMSSAAIVADAVVERLRKGRISPLRAYERKMQSAIDKYFRFISYFYRPEFLEVFLRPQNRLGMIEAIVGVLGGNVFAARQKPVRLAIFFALVKLQKWRGMIAPRLDWDALPEAASRVRMSATL